MSIAWLRCERDCVGKCHKVSRKLGDKGDSGSHVGVLTQNTEHDWQAGKGQAMTLPVRNHGEVESRSTSDDHSRRGDATVVEERRLPVTCDQVASGDLQKRDLVLCLPADTSVSGRKSRGKANNLSARVRKLKRYRQLEN